ncbi:tripartite motif-containing protein 2-like isoform X1 [Artemia franciscana]
MDNNRLTIQSFIDGKVVSMSSTLVETISINYEDFSESFLTCSTCLCTYDGCEHTPKLLPCSHTVCLQCLTRILASATRNDEIPSSFRCPICRESINVPRGGVSALPPSFIVNQLLDLMATQRREVIPKCGLHSSQELLFCETCDTVFCVRCTEGLHGGGSDHTVIPFAVAIKRMSEILLYRANECIGKLQDADTVVSQEIRNLEQSREDVAESIERIFNEIYILIDRKKEEVLTSLNRIKDEKKEVLENQLSQIHAERSKVERDCEGLQYQMEVRNITMKINDLKSRIDGISALLEPKENSFLSYEEDDLSSTLNEVNNTLDGIVKIRTSKTHPSACIVEMDDCHLHVEVSASLVTCDINGKQCCAGGDPVSAHVQHESGSVVKCNVIDNNNGTYEIRFRPKICGEHALSVRIFGRHVKNSPMSFICDGKIPLKSVYGSKGTNMHQLSQPVDVVADNNGFVYVLDTGNDRIHKLNYDLKREEIITNDCLIGRSSTGICINESDNLLVVNWRSKFVTELTSVGEKLSSFTCTAFEEPVAVACSSRGQILIADTGRGSVFVFDNGKLVKKIGGNGQFNLLAGVTCGPNREVICADSRLQVFSQNGDFLREIYTEGKGKGRYGGIALDPHGHLLATRIERSRSFVQVFEFKTGVLLFQIECEEAKFRRPAGIAYVPDGCLVAVDLGNECLKRFRYF